MMTVNEVSKLAGVSVRTLQYYDKIGLLVPAGYSESGYRLYDDSNLEKLQQILLFRELEFPLKDIKRIMENPGYDKTEAIRRQIELLTLKKEHIENLITLARGIKLLGVNYMNFKAFDTKKIDEYAKQAKENWGKSDAYKEFEAKTGKRSKDEEMDLGTQIMNICAEFGKLKAKEPGDPIVQAQVKKLQDFITENYYNCTDAILSQLGLMYAAGGEFTENINARGGEGCAEFANKAIQLYCKNK